MRKAMCLPIVFLLWATAIQVASAHTGTPVDVFPLATGNEWVYRYQRVDSLPYATPPTYTLDTGAVSYTITNVLTADPLRWPFKERRNLHRHIHYLSSSRPDSSAVIQDSSEFEILEELHGQHWVYRDGPANYYESLGVFSFDTDFTDTTKVYRRRPVGPNGTVTFLSQVPPGDIPFVFTFEEGVGLTHVSGWWSILSGRVYCEHQLVSWSLGPLPIQLNHVNAVSIGNNTVRVAWGTLSEVNNYGFEVQKRMDGQNEYATIPNSFVPGNGTTNIPHEYSYVDQNVSAGSWFYRLKQIDLDGRFHYSDGVQVYVLTSVDEGVPRGFVLGQNYPNPFNPSTTIEYVLPRQSSVSFRLFDVLGREVRILDEGVKSAGRHLLTIDLHDLGSGSYMYQFIDDGRTETKRMMLAK